MSRRDAELEKEVKVLRAKLNVCETERAALQMDVEMLCLQTTPHGSSSVLQERIKFSEKELAVCREALMASREEVTSAREDLRTVKASHRGTSAALRETKDRAGVLEKELAFYQAASVKAVSERDQIACEADSLREDMLRLETRLNGTEAQLATQTAARNTAEEMSLGLRADLRVAEATAAKVPELNDALDASRERQGAQEAELGELRAALQAARAEAQAGVAAGDELRRRVEALEAALREEEAARRTAEAEVEARGDALARSRQEAEDRARQMVEARRAERASEASLLETRSSLEEVASQKVQALLRQSEAEGLVGELKERVAELQGQLDVARREIEAAVLEANGAAGGKTSPGKKDGRPLAASPPTGGSWFLRHS